MWDEERSRKIVLRLCFTKLEKMSAVLSQWRVVEEMDILRVGWTFPICSSPVYLRVGYFVQPGTLQHPGAVVKNGKKSLSFPKPMVFLRVSAGMNILGSF